MYEAKQNKEKVSRRIDGGGMARQRITRECTSNLESYGKKEIGAIFQFLRKPLVRNSNQGTIQLEPDHFEYGYYDRQGKRKSLHTLRMEEFGDKNRNHKINPDEDDVKQGGIGDVANRRPEDPESNHSIRINFNKAHNIYIYISTHFENLGECDNFKKSLSMIQKKIKDSSILYKNNIRSTDIILQNAKSGYEGELQNIEQLINHLVRIMLMYLKSNVELLKDVPDNQLEDVLKKRGNEIWRDKWYNAIWTVNSILKEEWETKKASVEEWRPEKETFAKVPKGSPTAKIGNLDYIGSLAKGYKGIPKQQIHFTPECFDVDANLDAPFLAAYAISEKESIERGHVKADKIEPLKKVQDDIWEKLKQVPGIDPNDKFEIYLDVKNVKHLTILGDENNVMKNVTNTVRKSEYIQKLHDMVWWIKIGREHYNNLNFDEFVAFAKVKHKPFKKIFENDKNMDHYNIEDILYMEATFPVPADL